MSSFLLKLRESISSSTGIVGILYDHF
jgi:hypothetical protein